MYQALYRKYRPKCFEDVVGQNVIVKTLMNSIMLNKIGHAYLFNGPRGSGKTSIAKILAKTVNCLNIKENILCGSCVFCTQNNNENMDIIEIDAASNNGVDEIREINNKVKMSPSNGKYKVYIIDEVHMLTIGAFNALLKTLEEPPAHIIFILATTDPQKVPITILSRCQRLDFKKISVVDIVKRLNDISKKEEININQESLLEIAKLSDGSLRDALSILEQAFIYTNNKITQESIREIEGSICKEELLELLQMIINSDLKKTMDIIDEYNNEGKNFIKIIEELIYLLRDILLSKTTKEEKNFPKVILDFENVKILEYIKILNDSLMDVKKSHNPKIDVQLSMLKLILKVNEIKEQQEKQAMLIESHHENNVNQKVNQKEKEGKNFVKQEKNEKISREINKQINNVFNEKYEKFKNIRIGNALANFSKKDTLEIKKEIGQINEYLLNEDYGYLATKVVDADIKAASDKYVVFVFKTKNSSDDFNEHISEIEKLIEKILKREYKIISTDELNWKQIRQQFNSKKIPFVHEEEIYLFEDIVLKKETNGLTNLFSEVLEYN